MSNDDLKNVEVISDPKGEIPEDTEPTIAPRQPQRAQSQDEDEDEFSEFDIHYPYIEVDWRKILRYISRKDKAIDPGAMDLDFYRYLSSVLESTHWQQYTDGISIREDNQLESVIKYQNDDVLDELYSCATYMDVLEDQSEALDSMSYLYGDISEMEFVYRLDRHVYITHKLNWIMSNIQRQRSRKSKAVDIPVSKEKAPIIIEDDEKMEL